MSYWQQEWNQGYVSQQNIPVYPTESITSHSNIARTAIAATPILSASVAHLAPHSAGHSVNHYGLYHPGYHQIYPGNFYSPPLLNKVETSSKNQPPSSSKTIRIDKNISAQSESNSKSSYQLTKVKWSRKPEPLAIVTTRQRRTLRKKDSPDSALTPSLSSSRGSISSTHEESSARNSIIATRSGRGANKEFLSLGSNGLSNELETIGVFMPLKMYYYRDQGKRAKRNRTVNE